MKGKVYKETFTALINSGALVTIFTQAGLRKEFVVDVVFARPMPQNENCVNNNNNPLNLVGFITEIVKVGSNKIKFARIVITREGKDHYSGETV